MDEYDEETLRTGGGPLLVRGPLTTGEVGPGVLLCPPCLDGVTGCLDTRLSHGYHLSITLKVVKKTPKKKHTYIPF